jgi:hypothetical protein
MLIKASQTRTALYAHASYTTIRYFSVLTFLNRPTPILFVSLFLKKAVTLDSNLSLDTTLSAIPIRIILSHFHVH